MLPAMRTIATLVASLSIAACQVLPANNTTQGRLDLAASGAATAKLTSRGTERVSFVVENRGPGALEYTVTDDRGRTMEEGRIERTRRSFTWRPLDAHVNFAVRAGAQPASFDYSVASEAGFTVEWDLSRAQPPRQ
jgi:hypothetical protein